MGKPKIAIAKLKKKTKPKHKKRLTARSPQLTAAMQLLSRPPVAAIEPPPGFRAVGNAQAMMEYGAPFFELLPEGDHEIMNKAMTIVQFCWNYGLPSTVNKISTDTAEIRDEIIRLTSVLLKIEQLKAKESIDMMIKRKEYLLPFDIQPKLPMIMFIRKEKSYQISQFNLASLNLSQEEYTPDIEDKKLVKLIEKLDNFLEIGEDYGKWEKHYFKTEDKCLGRFGRWLDLKKMDHAMIDHFLFNIQIYMNFIYRYGHNTECNFKIVSGEHFTEFFTDHVLRKATVDPPEYAYWPPAMKLFYQFIENIGYLDNAAKIIKLIDRFEPAFIKILQKRYE